MRSLSDTLARLKQLPNVDPHRAPTNSRLSSFSGFGSNPGELDAWIYVPEKAPAGAPLVVVLHGCTQNAAVYDNSSGWSRLADLHGFVVLYPEQRRSNNSNLCFNWFREEDAARGKGEAFSIREMIRAVCKRHCVDPQQIFVTGLSAGGAMAAAMLATYPDVFAGGAVIAGLPFGVAQSVPEAFDRMRGRGGPAPSDLSNLVRAASRYTGDWPILSVWHGSRDQIVDPSNAQALVQQWRELHSVRETPSETRIVNGYPRRVWTDGNGRAVVEEYSVTGFGHGTPLDAHSSEHGENVAPFMIDAGISSTHQISRFWDIVPDCEPVSTSAPMAELPNALERPLEKHAHEEQFGGIQVGRMIEEALRTAGLIR